MIVLGEQIGEVAGFTVSMTAQGSKNCKKRKSARTSVEKQSDLFDATTPRQARDLCICLSPKHGR